MIVTILYLFGIKPKQVFGIATGIIIVVAMAITVLLGIHVTMNYSNTVNVQVAVIQKMDPRGFLGNSNHNALVTSDEESEVAEEEDDVLDSIVDSADDTGGGGIVETLDKPVDYRADGIEPKVGNAKGVKRRGKFNAGYRQPNNTPDTSYLWGKCVTGRNHILMYNRVPKCGSRTLLELSETLAPRYGYHKPLEIVVSKSKWQRKKMEVPYADIVRRRIKNMPVASILHGHIYFIDFSRDQKLLPHKRPIYLNLIRDPFDRLVSQYYFVRFGDGKFTNLKQLHKMTHPNHLNESFNDCVERDRPECIGPYVQSLLVKYFCGYSPDCQQPTEGALEEAKQNLDKFVVVGVAEEYEDYLKVLEKLVPDFFGGILKEFKSSTEKKRERKMKAKKKSPVSPEVERRIRGLLELDYRFYNYTRDRFHELKQRLGIS